MLQLETVGGDGRTLTVSLDGSPTELHAMWLRDACVCPDCRRPTSNERLLDPTSIDPELTISAAAIEDGELRVDLDGHRARIPVGWLDDHLTADTADDEPARGLRLWSDDSSLPRRERADLATDDGLRWFLDAVLVDGAAVVAGVEPSDGGLREIAGVIGEIRATNYGITWRIDATIDPETEVDSHHALRVHTDLPYREVAPGIQFLLAAVTEVDGGASTLVDGYAVAEGIRRADPDAWRLLTTTEFTYPFVRDDAEFHGRAPLIGLQPDGRYHQIRRAPDLVGVPHIDAEGTPALYAALRRWDAALDDDARARVVPLDPGDLLVIHNHRVLHGRTAFDLGAAGRRMLLGCYLDVEDARSRHAVLSRSS